MKKKLWTLALSFFLVSAMLPGGVFHAEIGWAASAPAVNIAGITLNSEKPYYCNGEGQAYSEGDLADRTPNATFDAATKTLTLNNLNVNTANNKGIQWGEHGNTSFHDVTIVLADESTNTIVSTSGTGIAGEYGGSTFGPSLTIKGNGRLNVTGSSYGIWVWKDITIEDNAEVVITGETKGGIYNNSTGGSIKIKDNANVTVHGGTYGIGYDHDYENVTVPSLKGGHLTVSGGTAAMMQAPNLAAGVSYTIAGSADENGTGAQTVDSLSNANISNYKYLKFTAGEAAQTAHTHCVCGAETHADVGDHKTAASMTFTAWKNATTLPTDGKAYYLDTDVRLSTTCSPADKTILCLNGHTIAVASDGEFTSGAAINVESGAFTITDCKENGSLNGEAYTDRLCGVIVSTSTTFNLYGGRIRGFKNSAILANGVAKMYGGSITDNPVSNIDGGVYIGLNGDFQVSGNVNISGNRTSSGIERNVYLWGSSRHITINGALHNSAQIGVKTSGAVTKDNPVTVAKAADGSGLDISGYVNNFKSDDLRYKIIYDTDAKEIKLSVDESYVPKTAVQAPAEDKTVYIYNGKPQTYYIPQNSAYIASNNTRTNAGTYKVTLALRDEKHTVWADTQDTADKTYTFTIKKAALTVKPKDVTIKKGDAMPTGTDFEYAGLQDAVVSSAVVIQNIGNIQFEFLDQKGQALQDTNTPGTYVIRFSQKPTFSYKSDNYEVTTGDGIFKITDTASGGSYGSYLAPPADVKTSGTTDSKVTSSPTEVKNETKRDADGNTVTIAMVTVSTANQREILSQAKANKSKAIVIRVAKNAVRNGAKLEIHLEKAFVQSILSETEAELTIQTADGEKVISQEELKNMVAQTTGNTMTIDPAAVTDQTDPAQPSGTLTPAQEKIAKGVENTGISLRSQRTKDGKVLLTWTKEKGYKVDYFEIYRSTKRSSGYSRKPFFRTPNGSWTKYLNTKDVEAGSTYYYKIRGVRVIDGKEYYTEYSTKAWRTIR